MLSNSKGTHKSLPALVIEFDQVLNGAMNEGLGYHEADKILQLYIDRLTTIRAEVFERLENARNRPRNSLHKLTLSQTASYMTRCICEQEDRIAKEVAANLESAQ